MNDSITVKLFRYDPSTDVEGRYETYEVPWEDDGCGVMTGLQALKYVYENIDSTLAYDFCCRAGLCGRCAMRIDGKPCLACFTPIYKNATHTFEPLETFPVIKDLVIDRGNIDTLFVQTKLACQTVEPIQRLENIDYDLYWEKLERMNMCRECLCCYTVCPKMNQPIRGSEFIGPGAMMQIGLRYLSVADEIDRVEQAAFSGLFECDLCGKCAEVCPSHIDFLGTISALQKDAEARGLKPSNLPVSTPVDDGDPLIASPASSDPTVIIQESCGTASCHDAQDILDYRADEDLAKVRVDSHAARMVQLTDEQKQALIAFFNPA